MKNKEEKYGVNALYDILIGDILSRINNEIEAGTWLKKLYDIAIEDKTLKTMFVPYVAAIYDKHPVPECKYIIDYFGAHASLLIVDSWDIAFKDEEDDFQAYLKTRFTEEELKNLEKTHSPECIDNLHNDYLEAAYNRSGGFH